MESKRASAPITLCLAALLGTAAHAGSYEAPAPVPTLAPPPPSVDWTGPYAGLQLGYADASSSAGNDDSSVVGVHLGYRWDMGSTVFGLEMDYGKPDLTIGGTDVDDVLRLKAQYGFDFGNYLAYGTAGVAPTDTTIGSETGLLIGVGIDYMMTPSFMLGAEVIYHDFNEFDATGVGATATTVGLRASFRF